jgi:heptosyltransferase III
VRILLISTREIGDLFLTTALLRSLRRAWATAHLSVLTLAGREGIVRGNPDIDAVLTIPLHASKTAQWHLWRKLWRRYDLALSTQSGDRPLLYAFAAAARRLALVPPPRPQDAWKRWICHNWREAQAWDVHIVRQNLWLAECLNIRPYFNLVPPQASAQDRSDWSQYGDFAVFHLSPRWHYKRWHLPEWAKLAIYLQQRGMDIILTGSDNAAENAYISQALKLFPQNTHNLAGQLNFAEVTTLLQQARIYVGPDTVVTHLAAATGTPTVALYGPTNPLKWSPWPATHECDRNPFAVRGPIQHNGNVVLIQGNDACVPCHEEGCERHRHSSSRCLSELRVDSVITGINLVWDSINSKKTHLNHCHSTL